MLVIHDRSAHARRTCALALVGLVVCSAPVGADAPVRVARDLVVVVRDPSGERVPQASAACASVDSEGHRRIQYELVRAGEVSFVDIGRDAEISVWGVASSTGRPLPVGIREGVVVRDSDRELEVLLPAGSQISGTVIGGAAVLSGTEVIAAVEPSLADTHTPTHRRVHVGMGGRFELIGVGARRYWLHVNPPPGFAIPAPIHVPGGTSDVCLTLAPAVKRRARVAFRGQPPPDGVLIRVGYRVRTADQVNAVAWILQSRAGPLGSVEFESLDARETLELEVVAAGPGRRPGRWASRSPWTEDDPIVVREPRELRGVVRTSSGAPAKSVPVVQLLDNGFTSGVLTDASGCFVLEGLLDDVVRLRIGSEDNVRHGYLVRRTAVAGSTVDVTLGESPPPTVECTLRWTGRSPEVYLLSRDGAEARRLVVESAGRLDLGSDTLAYEGTLWVPPTEGSDESLRVEFVGYSARRRDLGPVRGGTISGSVRGVGKTTALDVVAVLADGSEVRRSMQSPDRFAISGLPPGDWSVLLVPRGTNRVIAEARARVGDVVELIVPHK